MTSKNTLRAITSKIAHRKSSSQIGGDNSQAKSVNNSSNDLFSAGVIDSEGQESVPKPSFKIKQVNPDSGNTCFLYTEVSEAIAEAYNLDKAFEMELNLLMANSIKAGKLITRNIKTGLPLNPKNASCYISRADAITWLSENNIGYVWRPKAIRANSTTTQSNPSAHAHTVIRNMAKEIYLSDFKSGATRPTPYSVAPGLAKQAKADGIVNQYGRPFSTRYIEKQIISKAKWTPPPNPYANRTPSDPHKK